jgi:transposase InsO family protein
MDERARFVFEADDSFLSFSELCRRHAISRPTGYKGQFRTLDGTLCYPLTAQDGHSRFLLDVKALPAPTIELTIPRFRRLFRIYGLPDRILTHNGTPFASNALGRLSRLSVYFVTLGITPEFIEPGSPHQNGRHERMHRTLKRATAKPPRASLPTQQRAFNTFRRVYNEV